MPDQTPANQPSNLAFDTEWGKILGTAYRLVDDDKRDAIGDQLCEAYSLGIVGGQHRRCDALCRDIEHDRNRLVEIAEAAYRYADEMAAIGSPQGLSAFYAKQLREALDRAGTAPVPGSSRRSLDDIYATGTPESDALVVETRALMASRRPDEPAAECGPGCGEGHRFDKTCALGPVSLGPTRRLRERLPIEPIVQPSRESQASGPAGLYGKYRVERVDGRDQPGGDKADARYFVLNFVHDPYAHPALSAYADACEAELPQLAYDLRVALARCAPDGAAELINRRQRVESFVALHAGEPQTIPDAHHAANLAHVRAQRDTLVEQLADLRRDYDRVKREHAFQQDRAERAEQDRDQLRYERHLLGACRMVLDRVVELPHSRGLRAEAFDMAQRIVDEIGHPITDEPALGPELRTELARVTDERDKLAATLAAIPDAARAANLAHARTERDQLRQVQRLTDGLLSDVVVTLEDWLHDTTADGTPIEHLLNRIRHGLREGTAPVPGSSRHAQEPGDRVEDGGMMGTLVRCKVCGGSGLLHQPDELPETAAPAPEPNEPTDDEIAADIDRAQEEVEAEAQGYAEAVARLRDDDRYRDWWTALPKQDPAYGYWQGPARRHLADYLETVGPDGIDVETGIGVRAAGRELLDVLRHALLPFEVNRAAYRLRLALGGVPAGESQASEPATPVNLMEAGADTVRRYAGELMRLIDGLAARGITPTPDSPVDMAPVDTALAAVDSLTSTVRMLEGAVPAGDPQARRAQEAGDADLLLESAWGVIANVGNPLGDWDSMSQQWREAAVEWARGYHAWLDERAAGESQASEPATTLKRHLDEDRATPARRRHALAFNAITEALKQRDSWVPLSDRMACAVSVLTALDKDPDASESDPAVPPPGWAYVAAVHHLQQHIRRIRAQYVTLLPQDIGEHLLACSAKVDEEQAKLTPAGIGYAAPAVESQASEPAADDKTTSALRVVEALMAAKPGDAFAFDQAPGQRVLIVIGAFLKPAASETSPNNLGPTRRLSPDTRARLGITPEPAAPKLAQGGRRRGCGPDCSERHTYEAGCAVKPPARAFLGEKPCGKPGCPCGSE